MHARQLALGLLIAIAATSSAQDVPKFQMPPGPAGVLMSAYIEAFNAGDSTSFRHFWDTHSVTPAPVPIEERLKRSVQMRSQIGTLEPVRLLSLGDERASLLVRSEKEGFLRFEFMMEPGPPERLRAIAIEQADEDEPATEPKASFAELARDLDEYLTQETATDRFSGVVLIANNDQVVFHRPYGYADRAERVANNTDTKFNLGSINKAFTALAIRQLADQGKLRLDDTLKTFLPDYPNAEAARTVTIRHLLEMTSGIGDFFGQRYEATPKESLTTIRSFLPLFADLPLGFTPGTSRRYSNGGYIVLGAIIEQVSGTDYYSYVRRHIFEPAGMKDTESFPKNDPIANRSKGYTRRGSTGSLQENVETLPGRGSSAGGGYSTAPDLLRYVAALKGATICSKDDPARAGFGVAGGAPGINAAFEWDPQAGTVVIVLANLDPPAAERVARLVRGWLPRS